MFMRRGGQGLHPLDSQCLADAGDDLAAVHTGAAKAGDARKVMQGVDLAALTGTQPACAGSSQHMPPPMQGPG